MPTRISKDPADVVDVLADHSAQMTLDDDTITASTWRVDGDGLEVETNPPASFTDTTATVWISGGLAGVAYPLVNTITTEGGRTYERTIRVHVYDR